MLYVYNVSTRKIVRTYRTERGYQRSNYAGWNDQDWNDAGLGVTQSPATGYIDGLHY